MSSTERHLRLTVAALMYATGETQADLAKGLRLSQGQVSRKQSGKAGGSSWTLADLDKLSAHYGIPVPDLLSGSDHAVGHLPGTRRASTLGGTQTTITPG
ncbi:BetR domain-containing protein [Streptomyces sp. 2112.2]|uniref:helix-turn-helix domain-containing protein n=1 Tax=Streptomyces sp. 2112.2 TaxID=1881024 RepID=UPI0008943222|nr:helix-turn-helix transcriptional regulator [Streptomyces sp. 2112.2]SEF16566.1 BetR domain-containing protein [Streptomyces sp. 2112.2]